MQTIVLMIWSKLQSKLMAVVVLLGIVYTLYFTGRRSGIKSQDKSFEKDLKDKKGTRNEITKDVNSRTDDDINSQLRRW